MNYTSFILKVKQKIWNFKISTKISMFYSILAIITVIISLIVYQKLHVDVMSKKIQEVSIQTLYSINSNINSTIDSINNCSKMIVSDKDVRKFILNGSYPNYPNNPNNKSISFNMYNIDLFARLIHMIDEFQNITSAYIIDNYNNRYSADKRSQMNLKSDIKNTTWYNKMTKQEGGYILSLNAGESFETKNSSNFVSLIREIRDIEKPSKINGTLILNISSNAFTDSYKEAAKDDNLGIIFFDENDKEIVSNKKFNKKDITEFVGKVGNKTFSSRIKEIDNTQYVESYLRIKKYDWKLVSIIPFDELSDESNSFGIIVFLIIFINVFMLFFGGIFISKIVTSPIKKLIQSMKAVENKKFNLVEVSTRKDEIGKLKNGYNVMISEIQILLEKTMNEQKIKRKIELNTLQQQVKPHFLYNTLDALGYLALEGGNLKLYDALEALGSYYRTSLSKGREVITISEEIQLVKSYLTLQKLRYGNIFITEYDIDNNVQKYKILKMVLQPLVENSIYHGIKPKGITGTIRVSVKLNGQKIDIVVEDDGVGIDEEELISLNNDKIESNELSFGIKGTIQRLRIFYGALGFYSIESKKRFGTKITIKIPAEMGE